MLSFYAVLLQVILIDLDIVDDVFVPEIINELGLNDFSRINE